LHEQGAKDSLSPLIKDLGAKFLHRTRAEASVLHELIERVHRGDAGVIPELEHLAHKIHGTGATFGFAAVSNCAREIEHLVEGLKTCDPSANALLRTQRLQRMTECTQQLAREVEAAAAL
jgi:HPt (histidine-containing phosphotransfer) domain-containing protein